MKKIIILCMISIVLLSCTDAREAWFWRHFPITIDEIQQAEIIVPNHIFLLKIDNEGFSKKKIESSKYGFNDWYTSSSYLTIGYKNHTEVFSYVSYSVSSAKALPGLSFVMAYDESNEILYCFLADSLL